MRWILKGAEVLDPVGGLKGVHDILFEGDRIADVAPRIDAGEDVGVESGSGMIAIPGCIDMHVHLRQPGQDDKETIRTGGRAAVQGGIAAVACMPNTVPPIDSEAMVSYVVAKALEESPAEVFPIAAVTVGQMGTLLTEMATLKGAGAVGFSDDGKAVKTAEIMRRALEYSKMLGLAIMDHCEEHTMTAGSQMNEGYNSTVLGLRGWPRTAEDIIVSRDCMLAEMTGGHAHICHVSTARSVEVIREARKRGARVTAEVAIHHLLLNDDCLKTFDTNYKVNPPLRLDEDRDALLEGLRDGTLDCLVSDHAPHTREDKEVEFDHAPCGISGVHTLLPLTLSEIVRKRQIPLETVVRALTWNPARILALPDGYGRIQKGGPGNVTLIDLKRPLRIDSNAFDTRGKNSPYHGWALMGAPVGTIVKGRMVMKDGAVLERWDVPMARPVART